MRKNINAQKIEGRLYDHKLVMKKVTNKNSPNYGIDFISGEIFIATDEEGLNVIPVHYTFVKELTNSNAINSTFVNLKQIIENGKTWVNFGKEGAQKLRVEPSLALNDFYPKGGDQLVTQQRSEGGFVTFISDLNPVENARNKFTFDTIIYDTTVVPADPDHNIPEDFVRIKAYVFDFKNAILPIVLIAKDSKAPGSVNYFIGLNASANNPVYTKVMGEIINTTVKIDKVMENAFGGTIVDSSVRQEREWVITWAQPQPYVFDIAETITKEEVNKALTDRNLHLEEVKANAKAYYAQRNAGAAASAPQATPATPTSGMMGNIPQGTFNFGGMPNW